MAQRILVVDDEVDLLRLIEYSLKLSGFEVATAKTGAQALEMIKASPPALVVLDVMLPDMSGLEICRVLRDELRLVDLPVLMLSARAQVPDRIAGLNAGADEYVVKPVDTDELIARVRGLIKRTQTLIGSVADKRGRLVGVVGARARVGTTTVALNVASALVASKKSVIAVELRPDYGAFSSQLGVESHSSIVSLLDPDREGELTRSRLSRELITLRFGLKVLFGPQKKDEYRVIDETRVRELLEGLSKMADFVVVDLPSQHSSANQVVAQLSNTMLLVVEPEAVCVGLGKSTLEALKSLGIRADSVLVVVSKRTPLPTTVPADVIEQQLQIRLAGLIPHSPDALAKAEGAGVPIVLSIPNSVAALAFNMIANRVKSEADGRVEEVVDADTGIHLVAEHLPAPCESEKTVRPELVAAADW